MISYELLKKLRDSGYPLREVPERYLDKIVVDRGENALASTIESKHYYHPILEELIEACGYGVVISYDADKYIAAKEATIVKNQSPSETVANLWLALNKEKNK